MNLNEWLRLYIKHKDAFERRLEDIHEEDDEMTIVYKDRTVTGYCMEELSLPAKTENVLIATLQKKGNVQSLIDNWDKYSEHPGLTIIFVNPGRNEKWLIKPHMHDRISDGEIGPGIWSMAESVTWA